MTKTMSLHDTIARIVGLVIGFAAAFILFGLAMGSFHGINPQSFAGVQNTLQAAAGATVTGAAFALLPKIAGRVARGMTVGVLTGLGVLFLAVAAYNRSMDIYLALTITIVVPPAIMLGWVAAERWRDARGPTRG